jgi:hypothetical protein
MKVPSKKGVRWVICIRSVDYETVLEVYKLYRAIPDIKGASHRLVRVIDESGEDYLYPKDYFLPVELSRPVKKTLLRAS